MLQETIVGEADDHVSDSRPALDALRPFTALMRIERERRAYLSLWRERMRHALLQSPVVGPHVR